MHPKIKSRPAGATFPVRSVKPLLLHEVANPAAPAQPASRRGVPVPKSATATSNHLRHHVSRRAQAS
jgi:hypothetical protein